MLSVKRFENFFFFKEHHSIPRIRGSNLSDKGVCLILRVFEISMRAEAGRGQDEKREEKGTQNLESLT